MGVRVRVGRGWARPEWLRGYWPLSRRCRSSSNLSMNALTAAGVDTITARSATAVCAFSSSSGVTWARLSKAKVHTGLRSAPEPKTLRSTPG